MPKELPTRFDPKAIEGPIYRRWMEHGVFHTPASEVVEGGADPYVIVIPPPNVTAVLHMGHGLNNTIQDVLVRWQRMRGRASTWIPGTDHAGIATQNVVERQLRDEGLHRDDLGREAFVERVWEFVDETGGTILDQLKAMGCSCDWDRTRFTLDPGLSRAVREVFVRLYEKGLIYRGEYIINWCPRCLTALSNEEAEGEEVDGSLYHLRYPLGEAAYDGARQAREVGAEAIGRFDDGRYYLTVSTTRPETMLGDTAVAVNPSDDRYRALVGAEVRLPLTGRTLPIISDDFVDPEFGTGMVKVTPAHDPNDFEMARRSGVEMLDIFTPDAKTNENVPHPFRGLDREEARTRVVEALKAEGLFGGKDDHRHSVPHCYRCGTVVEPRLSEQWFVKMKPLAEPALEASRSGAIRFTPDRWTKVYEHWMENIRDWCISRQLWWGHRIPVWYCDDCEEIVVSRTDPDACPACGSDALTQDPDVLDTWFSSWLWPFSVFGWPEESPDLSAFYPGHTMVTAPEILFFWVARMIMSGYEFQGEAPFTEVYLHGTVRDKQGRKMSKSLGNGIDPMDVIEQFGADALRFTLISSCAVGTDIYLDHEDLEASFSAGRNFANKLWNAGRFTLMSVGEGSVRPVDSIETDLEAADRWILSRLSKTATEVTRELERFRLHEVSDRLYHFFWGDFADWYLELVKTRLWGEQGDASREAARSTLVEVFDGVLRLLHPIVPFVTTALWDELPWPEGRDRPAELILAPWPEGRARWLDSEAESVIGSLQELITEVRKIRKEYGVQEGRGIQVGLTGASDALRATIERYSGALSRMARVDAAEMDSPLDTKVGAHAVLSTGAELFLPLEGVIDLDTERARIQNEIKRLSGQRTGAETKLRNESFTTRAPEEVVRKERDKVERLDMQIESLEEKLRTLDGI